MLTIYRIENPKTRSGMWYNANGEYDPYIFSLTEGISKDLPMEPHARYRAEGKEWFSGCANLDDLKGWFSPLDAKELEQGGYFLFIFQAIEYKHEETQVLFTKESVQSVKRIDISEVWVYE